MEDLKFCYIPSLPFVMGAARALSSKGKQWKVGEVIEIAFIGGTKRQKDFVEKIANELTKYANIKFKWGVHKNRSDVRINFQRGAGSWSYVGTDALFIDKSKPTMNFGWVDKAVVLHEFGHMLSLLHEHSNPNGGIEWNKKEVVKDLSGPPNNWDLRTINHNVLNKVSISTVNATEFDPKSVMLYYFPKSWTLNMDGTNKNNELSETDKEHLRELYPFVQKINKLPWWKRIFR